MSIIKPIKESGYNRSFVEAPPEWLKNYDYILLDARRGPNTLRVKEIFEASKSNKSVLDFHHTMNEGQMFRERGLYISPLYYISEALKLSGNKQGSYLDIGCGSNWIKGCFPRENILGIDAINPLADIMMDFRDYKGPQVDGIIANNCLNYDKEYAVEDGKRLVEAGEVGNFRITTQLDKVLNFIKPGGWIFASAHIVNEKDVETAVNNLNAYIDKNSDLEVLVLEHNTPMRKNHPLFPVNIDQLCGNLRVVLRKKG